MTEIKSLSEQQKLVQAEIKQLENRQKILLNRNARITRLYNWSKENAKQPEK